MLPHKYYKEFKIVYGMLYLKCATYWVCFMTKNRKNT